MRDDVFKIQVKDHGLIDRFLFGYLIHPVIDFFYNYGFIPNHLTTFSFLFQLMSFQICLMIQKEYKF